MRSPELKQFARTQDPFMASSANQPHLWLLLCIFVCGYIHPVSVPEPVPLSVLVPVRVPLPVLWHPFLCGSSSTRGRTSPKPRTHWCVKNDWRTKPQTHVSPDYGARVLVNILTKVKWVKSFIWTFTNFALYKRLHIKSVRWLYFCVLK